MDLEYDELKKDFSQEQIEKLDGIIEQYRGQPGGLIPVLERAQELLGFLPIPVQRRVGRELGIPFSHVYGVVTFYSFFYHEAARQTHRKGMYGNRLLCEGWAKRIAKNNGKAARYKRR